MCFSVRLSEGDERDFPGEDGGCGGLRGDGGLGEAARGRASSNGPQTSNGTTTTYVRPTYYAFVEKLLFAIAWHKMHPLIFARVLQKYGN